MDVPGALTLDNNALRLQAALAGVGLVNMNAWAVQAHLRSRRLVRVFGHWTPTIGRLAL